VYEVLPLDVICLSCHAIFLLAWFGVGVGERTFLHLRPA
jgi:hypothetical protein